jgi:aspartokinase/homoserine dehydrogenase 1
VIIDCTSNQNVANMYPMFFKMGINVITPNKKANSGSLDFYKELRDSAKKYGKHYLYETTVGAGLPIINTLKEALATGDKVINLQGILSGTLSYIFNELNPENSFSEVVKEAQRKGYTEPDPRDDLSGIDVARKLVILAREMGIQVELKDVVVESLVPEELKAGSADEFIQKLSDYDNHFKKLMDKAENNGSTLKYVASISEGGALSVSLRECSKSHPFSHLSGSDNVVYLKTKRYNKQPLIIQGPGAGAEVTAAGVFGDLIRLASYFGAKL